MRLLAFCLLFPTGLALAQGRTSNRLREVFKDMTAIENPFDLRDPFKPPLIKSQTKDGRADKSLMRDGVYTNISPLGEAELSQLRIVGVIIGRERRALTKIGTRPDIIVLKEGQRIGKDNAELKAIHPGGVIFVEKLVNVYGEEEFLETVIPISQ